MKLNPETGQALGAINGPASIDGKQILPLGASASWLNKDTIIYGTWDDGHRTTYADIRMYHIPTGNIEIVQKIGFNFLQAGGNRWEAWLGSLGGVGYGCFGAVRDERAGLAGGRHGAVSWDGTIGLVPSYAEGKGLVLYAADGRITEVPMQDAVPYGLQVLGPTSALWTTNAGIKGFNVNVPSVQYGYAFQPRRCYFPERDTEKEWIVYWSNAYGGLIAHPYDKLEGYVLCGTDNAYWSDAIAWKGKIRAAFSWRQGELPEDVRIVDVDLSAPRVNFLQQRPQGAGSDLSITQANTRIFISGDYTADLAVRSGYSDLVRPQLGLYEDDIVYRLSMLATNILEPLKKRYPRLIVKSGFREVNGGVGQHEKGEAVDIELANQTEENLLEMAKWIRDNLPFDQLILNYSNQVRPWIHVSFSPETLRRDVLTKNYADAFLPGLSIVRPLTGEAAAAALRQQSALDNLIVTELTKMQARETRGGFAPVYGDDVPDSSTYVASGTGVEGSGGEGGEGGEGNGSDYASVVACVINKLYANGYPPGFDKDQRAFHIVLRVAWLLRDQGVGLLIKEGGENIIQYGGYSLSTQRICFPDGTIYDILGGASTGNPTAQWNPNGQVESNRYVPAIDPGTEINMDWLSCAL